MTGLLAIFKEECILQRSQTVCRVLVQIGRAGAADSVKMATDISKGFTQLKIDDGGLCSDGL